MNSFSSSPSIHEQGFALCIPKADCTAARLRLLTASQWFGRRKKTVRGRGRESRPISRSWGKRMG